MKSISLGDSITLVTTKYKLNIYKFGLEALIRETENKLNKCSDEMKETYESMIKEYQCMIDNLVCFMWDKEGD